MARARLTLERLEDRSLPAAFNVPWPEAVSLTLSFAPDGTQGGGQTSSLFRALGASMSRSAWQLEILRAFQTWAVQANLNIGLVSDGGQPFDTLGFKQGDPRFGDVRIGAFPMASDVLGVANPYDPFVANAWVGDVFLNSSYHFGQGGQGNSYDLFSVLLHEAGHVFGLGHSADPGSPMFEHFHSIPQSGLTAADIAALQALYGNRQPDALEGAAGNDSFATATDLTTLFDAEGDVTTLDDVDTYRWVVPDGSASVDVRLHASGISLLVPRVSIYDESGRLVSDRVATSPLGNDLVLHLDHVHSGATYYVTVRSGTQDVFGIGRYQLAIEPGNATGSPLSSTEANMPIPLATTAGYVEHSYYEIDSKFGGTSTERIYQVRSVDLGPDMTNVMTVVVSSPHGKGSFHVAVLDEAGNPVSAQPLPAAEGTIALQVSSVVSNRDYYVRVWTDPSNDYTDLEVEVDYALDASHLTTILSDSLAADQAAYSRELRVDQSQHYHFVLSASDWSNPSETGVKMTILDEQGHPVFIQSVADGAVRSSDVFLDAGRYTLLFERANSNRFPLLFKLESLGLSSPLGPQLRDTIATPVSAQAQLPPVAMYWQPNPAQTSVLVAGSMREPVSRDATFPAAASAMQPTAMPVYLTPPINEGPDDNRDRTPWVMGLTSAVAGTVFVAPSRSCTDLFAVPDAQHSGASVATNALSVDIAWDTSMTRQHYEPIEIEVASEDMTSTNRLTGDRMAAREMLVSLLVVAIGSGSLVVSMTGGHPGRACQNAKASFHEEASVKTKEQD